MKAFNVSIRSLSWFVTASMGVTLAAIGAGCEPETRLFNTTSTASGSGSSSSGMGGSSSSSASSSTGGIMCMGSETLCTDTCVDVMTDDKNCGACGHDCQGGGCVAGACQPISLADGLRSPNDIAVDADSVYWTQWSGQFGGAFSVPTMGGSVAKLSGMNDAYAIALGSGLVYFTQYLTAGGIYSVPIAGGTETLLASNMGRPASIALGGGSFYLANQWTGNVSEVPLAGGNVTVIAASQGAPVGVATDGTDVYWTCGCSSMSSGVSKLSPGGSPVVVATNQPFPLAIVTDATNVYWINQGLSMGSDGSVMKAAKATGQLATLADNQDSPNDIAVDGQNAYFTTKGGYIMSISIDGNGAPVVLAKGQNAPKGIAVDATTIYWVNGGTGQDGSVMKLAK